MDYVNPPVGEGRKPPSPLQPAPRRSRPPRAPAPRPPPSPCSTSRDLKVKTGISHRYLRPPQAIVDPELTRTLPAEVTSSAGLDVVCHAAESFLSKPYDQRERPASPDDRPPYQGANPVADVWSAKALEFGGRYLRRAVADAEDLEARGVHDARARRWPASASARPACTSRTRAPIRSPASSTPTSRPATPTTTRSCRTGTRSSSPRPRRSASPTRRRPSATTRSPSCCAGEPIEDAGPDTLPDVLRALMRDVGAPRGVAELGYDEDDVPALVEGALKQQRLLVVSPREATADDLGHILNASMTNW